MARLTALKQELAELEQLHKGEQAALDALLLRVPNVPAPEVPEGQDDSENVEIKRWGEPRALRLRAARPRRRWPTAQGWLDIERGARLAGSRNYVLQGRPARCSRAR